jgi:phosphoglucosamine mutase
MSNLGFDIMAKKEGLKLVKTKVGDRYVLEEMLEKGYVLGGENSGHVIFLEYNTTGDGLLTALQLLQVMKNTGKKLSELANVMLILPQVLKNAKVKNELKYKYLEDETIADMCKQLEDEFHGEGRVLIRPSGTEPLVRVMIEGKDIDYITQRAIELKKLIEERLG